ncbi:hypothetical protein MOB76_07730 [Bacillus inaquosorum]|nr:hypothetical protein [Bacillus inaquosorum]MCY7962858.1 hypothetical protein [Bacillus inaquosorum]
MAANIVLLLMIKKMNKSSKKEINTLMIGLILLKSISCFVFRKNQNLDTAKTCRLVLHGFQVDF